MVILANYLFTVALPKSSQRRRIFAKQDVMPWFSFTTLALFILGPPPRRKNMCTITTCAPVLTIPLFK